MRTTISAGGALLIALVVLVFPGAAMASTADPMSWDFAAVPINTTVSKQITITLDSGYQIVSASGSGINDPYNLTFDTCAGFTGPGTCTITELFNPTTPGPSTADTSLNTCSTTTCITIPIHFSGSGISLAGANPSSWDFAAVPINTTVSKQITITLDSGYQIVSASGSGINDPYNLTFDTCAGFTGPGTCTITELFNPTTPGPSTADTSLNTCSTTTCITIPIHFSGSGVDDDLALANVPANISVDAAGPSGAVVTYTPPTATDEDATAPTVTCSPASGTTFPIGTTTVHCSATDPDDSNSPVSASFTVTVRGAGVQLQALLTFVRGLPPGTSLPDKVQTALNYFNRGDIRDACIALTGVINQAQALAGKKLTTAQANAVIAAARNIRAVLRC